MPTENEMIVLLPLLDQAEQLSAQFTGGYSGDFFSAEEFLAALAKSIHQLKKRRPFSD